MRVEQGLGKDGAGGGGGDVPSKGSIMFSLVYLFTFVYVLGKGMDPMNMGEEG